MKIHNTLEDCLNGGWPGLHGEVVTEDCYGLKTLDFVPDLVFDIGANVGTFTRFANDLFPKATIIALEPDASNLVHFRKFTPDTPHIKLVEGALGRGAVVRVSGAVNGAHEVYLTEGLGYPDFEAAPGVFLPTPVIATSLDQFIRPWLVLFPKAKTLVKIDCEGGENSIWEDEDSMETLSRMDYIAMELHYHANHGANSPVVHEITDAALDSFDATHDCDRGRIYFTARKKR